ncbi:hypothetical protein QFC21_004964 [Naganishia friedmannii]|uniref:Uncharacterized protein n=1 Tax=Naganishia friedmannii TaxID=89922 RepID=A0ACC2VDW8_9TREE|nr:hypothetical protein QFC21_004964 [Naganishia friedmannii]
MPPSTQTTDLEEFTARVQKAATAHSVNENEFGNNIYKTLRITGMDLEDEDGPGQQAGKPKRKKAKVIVETVVRKDFLNPVGVLHGAATAYIIDMQVIPRCPVPSSKLILDISPLFQLLLAALDGAFHFRFLVRFGRPQSKHVDSVSRTGTRLKIISETLNVGGRIANMRCEIRNADNNKLIASGFHSKVNVTPKTTNKAVPAKL